jgi:hypothetical protein
VLVVDELVVNTIGAPFSLRNSIGEAAKGKVVEAKAVEKAALVEGTRSDNLLLDFRLNLEDTRRRCHVGESR